MLIEILKKMFGRDNALRVWVALHRWFAMSIAAIVLTAAAVAFFVFFDPEHHRHVGYEEATVLHVVPWPSDTSRQRWIVGVRLSDGRDLNLIIKNHAVYVNLVDTACLEHRRFVDSREDKYLIVPTHNCADI